MEKPTDTKAVSSSRHEREYWERQLPLTNSEKSSFLASCHGGIFQVDSLLCATYDALMELHELDIGLNCPRHLIEKMHAYDFVGNRVKSNAKHWMNICPNWDDEETVSELAAAHELYHDLISQLQGTWSWIEERMKTGKGTRITLLLEDRFADFLALHGKVKVR